MNVILAAVLSAGMALSLTGCSWQRKIVVPKTANEPDFSQKTDVTIDWDQVRDECEEILNDKDAYPHSSYIDFAVHDDQKVIELIWVMTNDANQLESLDYGKTLIKTFNDVVANQDFSIRKSSENDYGGLWDKYGIDLQLYREKSIMTPDNYFVNQIMDPGSNDPVLPLTKQDIESMNAAESSAEAEQASKDAASGTSAAAETSAVTAETSASAGKGNE